MYFFDPVVAVLYFSLAVLTAAGDSHRNFPISQAEHIFVKTFIQAVYSSKTLITHLHLNQIIKSEKSQFFYRYTWQKRKSGKYRHQRRPQH
ncbi:hypothetical protein TNIN_225211 [Trichonephila inaurata madagascariensis]|uniref:Secreted protein n=1 Tax=Trichonephila inaurata madagascariensis TaxID=2747483 RepID=A0A8X7C314_9ARAC|nr:hypothetical protein TNIN_225211 [Trichonephila inaurata madagascariensis]